MSWKRYYKYLSYVFRHKYYVFIEGRKLGVSVVSLLLHDWTKFTPSEMFPYARTFRTKDGKKIYATDNPEFKVALLSHIHTHKHHWQYWILVRDGVTQCLPMPNQHRKEMLADWKGAGIALGEPDTTMWYLSNKNNIMLHEETRKWIEEMLDINTR